MNFKIVGLTAAILLGAGAASSAQNSSSQGTGGAGSALGPQQEINAGKAQPQGAAKREGGNTGQTSINSGNAGSSPGDHQTNQRNPGPYAPSPSR